MSSSPFGSAQVHQAEQGVPEASREPPFWIVREMQPGHQIRKYGGHFWRHSTRESADTEAKRLATKFKGRRFVVLQAVNSFLEGDLDPRSLPHEPVEGKADVR